MAGSPWDEEGAGLQGGGGRSARSHGEGAEDPGRQGPGGEVEAQEGALRTSGVSSAHRPMGPNMARAQRARAGRG